MTVFTIGHSTRTAEDFLALLKEFKIETLADIRRFPSSRTYPHFNSEPLRRLLLENDIDYVWFEALGGLRKAGGSPSPNMLLKNEGFRNYADYMMSQQFRASAGSLIEIASARRVCVMCAERLYWKCHRMLLADYLTANDVEVKHIVDHGQVRVHELFKGALITADKTVIYPAGPEA